MTTPVARRGHIPWSTVDLQIAATRSIGLATTRSDGRPHAVPVWFVWRDQRVYFVSGQGMQKARNLVNQPWVVLHLGDGDDVVILEGLARVVHDPAELRRVDSLYSQKYVAPRSGVSATIFHEDVDLWRVDVRRVMAWAYGNVNTRTDLELGRGVD
jgi:PPOX class probable F420-dependent enzyme